MSSRHALAALLFVLGPSVAHAERAPDVATFFRVLYAVNEPALATRFAGDFNKAVARGMPDTPINRRRFNQTLFVYWLVKRGGILGNAYLVREEDGRHPDVMLRDALAAAPRYKLLVDAKTGEPKPKPASVGATLFAFGRCDELEMEAAALLQKVYGLVARVAMIWSNHVNTEVAMQGGFLIIDTSFRQCIDFLAHPVRESWPEDGRYDIERANRLALRDFHPSVRIDENGAERVRKRLAEFLNGSTFPAQTDFCPSPQ